MRLRLFWKIALAQLLLLCLVLLAVDIYAAAALRRDYLRAATVHLDSLARLAESHPPRLDDPVELHSWTGWMARSGARVTVITSDGRVLADSAHDPETMENHAGRPEVREAMAGGRGLAVRHSHTLNRDLVYLALRHQPATGPPVVLRLALPLAEVDEALRDIRTRLAWASLTILVLGAIVSLLYSHAFSERIERLKQFSRRVAGGDFRPVAVERVGDELSDLAQTLNETAVHLDQTVRTLTQERNQSAAILSSMAEAVAVIGPDERLVFSNQAFCRTFGVDAAQDRPFLEVVRQPDLVGFIRQVLAGQEGAGGEVVLGTVRPQSFAVAAAPVRADGATGAVLVLHDISELRRLERVRRDFVANVSHELKTPLTAIQGFAETLLAGALEDPGNSRRFLGIIRDHAARLGRLTDDLLKLSLIEAGQLELEFRPVAVHEVIEPCLETTRFKAAGKQLQVSTDCPPGLPTVRGDVRRLQEILQNLLDNAVQYTPAGGRIHVRASAAEGQVTIAVSDTGIGIPQADQGRIFERFYRVDAARSREVGGTGLGLSIAKHLAEAHGGRIEMESEVGRGSTFTVILPAL